MENMNSVSLCGNLVADPSLKSNTVLTFTIAVNERRKIDEEWEDVANFFDCVIFGARCKALSEILSKGMKVAILGRLHQNKWENEDGETRSKVEVVVDNIEIMVTRIPDDSDKSSKPKSKTSKTKR